ncbi:MAG: hypothetical protein ABIH83_05625 [Candidatus Micrarchaeota archaeon]
MEKMEELSSEVDYVIRILRANPNKNFNFKNLHNLTGMPVVLLRKWIELLEENGQVKISYNLSNEEVSWVGESRERAAPPQIPEPNGSISKKTYDYANIPLLIEEIKTKKTLIERAEKRKMLFEEKNSADNATIRILELRIKEQKKDLFYLLNEARKLSKTN